MNLNKINYNELRMSPPLFPFVWWWCQTPFRWWSLGFVLLFLLLLFYFLFSTVCINLSTP